MGQDHGREIRTKPTVDLYRSFVLESFKMLISEHSSIVAISHLFLTVYQKVCKNIITQKLNQHCWDLPADKASIYII